MNRKKVGVGVMLIMMGAVLNLIFKNKLPVEIAGILLMLGGVIMLISSRSSRT